MFVGLGWQSYESDKIAQKGRPEKILNSYFVHKVIIVWVSGPYHLITKGMVRELITFLKHKKIAGSSGLVSKIVKLLGGAEICIITNLKKTS